MRIPALALALIGVEARQQHVRGHRSGGAEEAQRRVDTLEVQIPLALAGLPEAVAERAVGHVRATGGGVDQDGLESRALGVVAQVGGGEELVRHVIAAAVGQRHQERQVGVLLDVVDEARDLSIDEELLEDHMPHRHAERAVGARMRGDPFVGELRVVRVVRRHHHDLLPAVARLGHEVGVRGAGLRDVGAPHDQVGGVPPVGGLGTSVWSPKTCGDATGRSQYQS